MADESAPKTPILVNGVYITQTDHSLKPGCQQNLIAVEILDLINTRVLPVNDEHDTF